MKILILAISSLLLAQASFAADLLTVVPGSQTCEGMPIAQTATLNLPQGNVGLSTLGFGLRAKKVVITNVKVYCLTIMGSEPATFVHSAANNAALNSTDGMTATALKLDFVRTVDAATVSQSFSDALRSNNVDLTDAKVQAFLSAVKNGGDAQSGKAITIAMDAKMGIVVYEDTNGKTNQIAADEKLIHSIMSIWLGNPDDSGLATLKTQLIGS